MSRFNWEQEHNIIKITVLCSNPIISKPGYFDLFVSRSYVKFHLKSPKIFMDFDLLYDIDPSSPLNTTIATETSLEIILAKSLPGQVWDSLINPDKILAKQKRTAAQSEVSETESKTREIAEKNRIEMDRLSVTEQMRLDTEKREKLEKKLLEEKNKAVKDIFTSSSSNQIFKQRTDIPQARQQFVQQLKFTPKRDPNLPARESTANEPPIPNPLRPYDGPAYESHPLFLKDKGDEFFKSGDYTSAINAYTKALKSDPKFVSALICLASSYFKTYEFDKSLETLDQAESLITEDTLKAVCYQKKGETLASKGMIDEALAQYRKAQAIINDDTLIQDIDSLEKLRESNVIKSEADKLYNQGLYQDAYELYLNTLNVYPQNELAWANLAQVSLKLGKDEDCLKYCDKALEHITHNIKLKVKVLLRKAKVTGDSTYIDQALIVDPLNPQAKAAQLEYKEKYNAEQFDTIKAEADGLLKSGKSDQALSLYKQLLSTNKNPDQKLSLLANACACYLIAKDYHGVVAQVQRAFKLNPKPSVRLRLLCRRAKAYAELGQLYSAECDLKEALTLDPDNETIKNDLKLIQTENN
jgi:dyslexia susceptibility 1 candidate gene 1 protein